MTEKDLDGLIKKLKENREKVPAELLRTRYAAAYGQLKSQISKALKEEASKIPNDLLPGRAMPPWLPYKIAEIFSRALDESALLPKLQGAVYRRYDAAEAMATAREVNKRFAAALADYITNCACLVFDLKEPGKAKIYNFYLGMYWDEAGAWRRPRADEAVPDAGSLWEEKGK